MKHLTLSCRIKIENGLNMNHSPTDIAKDLNRPVSTIRREIIRNSTYKHSSLCDCTGVCQKEFNCDKKYFGKNNRPINCSDFQPVICPNLRLKSSTCNACDKFDYCRLQKRKYIALEAQKNYEKTNSQARQGINMQPKDFIKLDETLSKLLIEKKQPINHIISTNDLPVSERTVYRWIDEGILSTKNIDLRRKVKYKPRKKKNSSKN